MPRGDESGVTAEGPAHSSDAGIAHEHSGGGRWSQPPVSGPDGLTGGRHRRGHRYRHWYRTTGLSGWQRAMKRVPWLGRHLALAMDAEHELEALRSWADHHERLLEEVRARIRELEDRATHGDSQDPEG